MARNSETTKMGDPPRGGSASDAEKSMGAAEHNRPSMRQGCPAGALGAPGGPPQVHLHAPVTRFGGWHCLREAGTHIAGPSTVPNRSSGGHVTPGGPKYRHFQTPSTLMAETGAHTGTSSPKDVEGLVHWIVGMSRLELPRLDDGMASWAARLTGSPPPPARQPGRRPQSDSKCAVNSTKINGFA